MSKDTFAEINKQKIEVKQCECGRCNEFIPIINKMGKQAKYKHGHNLRTPEITKKAREASPGHTGFRHLGDLSRFGKQNIGKIPTNAIQRGEHRGRSTEFKRGHISSDYNKMRVSDTAKRLWETDEDYRKACMMAPRKKKKSTSIEITIQLFLEKLEINFLPQFYISYGDLVEREGNYGCSPDFFIPEYNLVIFCDGKYWHGLEKTKKRDKIQNKILPLLGYRILRMNDNEIKEMTVENFKLLLSKYSPVL